MADQSERKVEVKHPEQLPMPNRENLISIKELFEIYQKLKSDDIHDRIMATDGKQEKMLNTINFLYSHLKLQSAEFDRQVNELRELNATNEALVKKFSDALIALTYEHGGHIRAKLNLLKFVRKTWKFDVDVDKTHNEVVFKLGQVREIVPATLQEVKKYRKL